jgi:pSer/pThr/pTyr-binding forkhead associated (FHA) protein
MPKPSVTLVPGTQKPEKSAAPQQPPRPSTPVYTPPAQPPTVQTGVSPTSQTMPARKPIVAKPVSQPAIDTTVPWGKLIFSDGKEILLAGERALVGRSDHDIGGINPEVDLSGVESADTTSRIHATIEHIGSTYTVTDLNSTNSTRINGKRLEPDKATPVNDGDKLSFGKVTCTFKKA